MKNVDRIYQLTNLLSFLIMALLLLDAMRFFDSFLWFNVDWAFGILIVVMCVFIFQAKRLNVKSNNPNLIFPISKYAYFASFVAFFLGYLVLEAYSYGQVVAYAFALVLDLFSSIFSMVVMSKMKKNIR
ncbi:MAG: hypothetical protein HOH13_10440 [Crocinitomicaceae bacterium]|jgi:hypothetical protein|nr:hypothetical protein [Crocinitomicaceae bacterium]MBT6030716.1 hypothetical protein [Crocinitomicaceae bacterium]MBT6513768.1 hypothetical protein [Crocinitomicaceae bacterium]